MANRNEKLRKNYARLRKVGFISKEINQIKFRKQKTINEIVMWAEKYQPAFITFQREKDKIVNDKDYIPDE